MLAALKTNHPQWRVVWCSLFSKSHCTLALQLLVLRRSHDILSYKHGLTNNLQTNKLLKNDCTDGLTVCIDEQNFNTNRNIWRSLYKRFPPTRRFSFGGTVPAVPTRFYSTQPVKPKKSTQRITSYAKRQCDGIVRQIRIHDRLEDPKTYLVLSKRHARQWVLHNNLYC